MLINCLEDKEFQIFFPMLRVFANGPEDQGSILDRALPKTQKVFLDTLFNTQYCKIRIKGKMEKSRTRSNNLTYTSV